MTFGEFKSKFKGGYTTVSATEKGMIGDYETRFPKPIKNPTDDMIVDRYLYNPMNGIYTVFLK